MVQAEAAAKQLGTTFRGESETVGKGLTAIGLAAGVGVGAAVLKFADFDAAMSNVQASTHESAANMDLLRDAALDAGAQSVFSAEESAAAIDELAKAGIATADVLSGGLTGSLDLAAAGGLGVADAASIAATALTQFKLKGGDVPHVADLLAAGAGKAQGSVQELGQALDQSGLIAAQTGLTIEETTGTLAAFASAGLIGSDAGTSFKTMLQALTPTSAEAKAEMDRLGISAYDAQGNFIGMEKFAGVLQNGLRGLSVEQQNAALKTIFGSDAVRAASVIYENGAQGIGDWIDKVDDSGYAADTARDRIDNLKGDLEALGGALDVGFIKGGSAANGALRELTQDVTGMVTAFTDAPLFIQQTSFILTGLVATVGLAGGAFMIGIPKVVEYGAALDILAASKIPGVAAASTTMIAATNKATTALVATARFLTGPWGIALAAAAAGGLILNDVLEKMKASAAEYSNVIKNAGSAQELFDIADKGTIISRLDEATSSAKVFKSSLDNIAHNDFLTGLSLSTQQLKARLGDLGKQFGDLAGSDLPSAQRGFQLLATDMKLSADQQADLLDAMPAYKDALLQQANALGIDATSGSDAANQQALLALAMGETTENSTKQIGQLQALAGASNDTQESIVNLADAVSNFGKAQMDTNSTNREFEQAVDDANQKLADQQAAFLEATGSMDGYSNSLDVGTQAGRDNQAALDAIASAANNSAAAILAQTGSVDQSSAALYRGKDALYAQLAQFGITGEAADVYVGKLLATPSEISTQAKLLGLTEATAAYESWFNGLSGRTLSVVVRATVPDADPSTSGNDKKGTYAYGGYTGPGGKFDAAGIVHRGEFVSTAETYAKPANRAALEFMHRGGDIATFGGVEQRFTASSAAAAARSAEPQLVQVEVTTNGDLGQFVDVRVNGALVAKEQTARLEQRQGWSGR